MKVVFMFSIKFFAEQFDKIRALQGGFEPFSAELCPAQ